eukprot:6408783-Pyramimonas_sp.AAC.1
MILRGNSPAPRAGGARRSPATAPHYFYIAHAGAAPAPGRKVPRPGRARDGPPPGRDFQAPQSDPEVPRDAPKT